MNLLKPDTSHVRPFGTRITAMDPPTDEATDRLYLPESARGMKCAVIVAVGWDRGAFSAFIGRSWDDLHPGDMVWYHRAEGEIGELKLIRMDDIVAVECHHEESEPGVRQP